MWDWLHKLGGEGRHLSRWGRGKDIDLMIKSAVAHLWFVTIHPFDDGNGRITRAITDLMLTRADDSDIDFTAYRLTLIRIETTIIIFWSKPKRKGRFGYNRLA